MPFEAGNQLSKKANHKGPKIWRDALLVSLKKANEEGVEAIQRLADKTVAEGLAGNMAAVKEIGERIDGKVPQAIGGDEDAAPIKHVLEIAWKSGGIPLSSTTNPGLSLPDFTTGQNVGLALSPTDEPAKQ